MAITNTKFAARLCGAYCINSQILIWQMPNLKGKKINKIKVHEERALDLTVNGNPGHDIRIGLPVCKNSPKLREY